MVNINGILTAINFIDVEHADQQLFNGWINCFNTTITIIIITYGITNDAISLRY